MAQQFPELSADHQAFIEAQKIFFVASAAPTGRINLSPKGLDSLRVLGPRRVAYLDVTGSGAETAAHLRAAPDARLTMMFTAFEGKPVILRLYGRGTSHVRGTPGYAELLPSFAELPGARQIVTLDIELVQTSCGMGVPLFDYLAQRDALPQWADNLGHEKLAAYQKRKNLVSMDGLPTGLDSLAEAIPK